jgi:hypothetical protein
LLRKRLCSQKKEVNHDLLVEDDMVGAHGLGFVDGDHSGIVAGFHIDRQLHLLMGTTFVNVEVWLIARRRGKRN